MKSEDQFQQISVDKDYLNELNNSPKQFQEKTNTKARIKMKSFRIAISEYHYWLKTEIGAWQAFRILLKSWSWDLLFNKPKWEPELFTIENEADGREWKKAFDRDVVPLVIMHRNLIAKYNKKKADIIMARFMMPVGLKYHFYCFKPINNLTHIDQLRQQMADYLGDGKTMRNKVWVSKDGTEVRYYYTKCMHIQMMVAYGMKVVAQGACMIDHVTFDKRIPTLKFKRTKTLSLGDCCCDHRFSIRQKGDNETPYDYYEDAHRCDFDAYKEIMKLEQRFDKYGPKLR